MIDFFFFFFGLVGLGSLFVVFLSIYEYILILKPAGVFRLVIHFDLLSGNLSECHDWLICFHVAIPRTDGLGS